MSNANTSVFETGAGGIASWFVSDLVRDPVENRNVKDVRHKVQAIGSSSLEKAGQFADKFFPTDSAIRPTLYDSYEKVYNDPEVDVVYIATPHTLHLKNALDAIKAGKHVLCEKPMTINARDSGILVSAAREKGVFLMEGKSTCWINVQFFSSSYSLLYVFSGLDQILSYFKGDPTPGSYRKGDRKVNEGLGRLWVGHAAGQTASRSSRQRSLSRCGELVRYRNISSDMGQHDPFLGARE